MIRRVALIVLMMIVAMILSLPGCEKEKIVESTEYVHDIEYVPMPGDTVYRTDTVYNSDTVVVVDTINQTDNVYDTVVIIDTVIQTDHIYDTTVVVDTVEVVVVDTVQTIQCNPDEIFASNAMQYYTNEVVIELINAEFGYNDGWIFYLSNHQSYMAQQSANVFDLYGFIDYWTPEWDGFYAFEYYWRMTFTGGDPADPNNWDMTEPPAATATHQPGIRRTPDDAVAQRSIR